MIFVVAIVPHAPKIGGIHSKCPENYFRNYFGSNIFCCNIENL